MSELSSGSGSHQEFCRLSVSSSLPKDFSAIIIKVRVVPKSAINSLKSFGRGAPRAYIAAKDLSTTIYIFINIKVSQTMIYFISVCRMSESSPNKMICLALDTSYEMPRPTSTKTDSSELSFKAIIAIIIASKVGSCLQQRLKINNAIQTFGEVFCSDPVGSGQMFTVPGGTIMISAMLRHIGEVFIVISAKADNIASKEDFSLERRPNTTNIFQIFGWFSAPPSSGTSSFFLVLVWTRIVSPPHPALVKISISKLYRTMRPDLVDIITQENLDRTDGKQVITFSLKFTGQEREGECVVTRLIQSSLS